MCFRLQRDESLAVRLQAHSEPFVDHIAKSLCGPFDKGGRALRHRAELMIPLQANPLMSHAPEHRRIEGAGTAEEAWQRSAIDRLPICDVTSWSTTHPHIWLIAPHPDDEVLGLGGCIATLAAAHADLRIISVSDGEASHRGSAVWTPERLASERAAELQRGLAILGHTAGVTRLGLPDGRLDACRQTLLRALVDEVGEDDLVLTTCSFDGHPDHETCGAVAALIGELTGATVLEYPVWMWHWAAPDETMIPWHRARRIEMTEATLNRKRAAIQCFESQLHPDGSREAVLPPAVVARFLRDFEVVFTTA